MEKTFSVKSSSNDTYYSISVSMEGEFRIRCNCPAGILKQMCKHKIEVIENLSKEFPEARHFLTEFNNTIVILKEIEKQISTLKKQEKIIKQEFANRLYNGI